MYLVYESELQQSKSKKTYFSYIYYAVTYGLGFRISLSHTKSNPYILTNLNMSERNDE